MKKVVRLTESDLTRIVRRVINESLKKGEAHKNPQKNPLRKLASELKSKDIDSKLSGINLDFIVVYNNDGEDLQVTINDKGQYIIQPRSAKNKEDRVLLKTSESYSGSFEDNLERGIDRVISFFKRHMDEKKSKSSNEYRPFHSYRRN
jgi:hypothetical protein